MKSAAIKIPETLIYEMVDGKPIYYKGYREILNSGNAEPMGSSLLQSMIITQLVILLHQQLGTNHYILTNELGLQFSKGNWRAADIAIYEKAQVDLTKLSNKYSTIPPKVVLEIDTKAEIDKISDTFTYYNKKTQQLLDFGVEKVIWIFTDTKKVMLAQPNENWQLSKWDKDISVLGSSVINIASFIE